MYYLDPTQVKAQQAVVGGGGIMCMPVQGSSGRSRSTVYRMAPSSLQASRVLQPVAGATIAGGLQCDSCPPQYRVQQVSLEDAKYGGAVAASEPQIVRVVPQGKSIFVEEVKPSSQQRHSRSVRRTLPNVMEIVQDRNWEYDKLAAVETSDSEVAVEPNACLQCIEELMRRRRAPCLEPAVDASPVYVTKVPTSRRLCSRRSTSSPQRTFSRGSSSTSKPRCSTCAECKSCGTVRSDSKPNTSRSRSRRWYE